MSRPNPAQSSPKLCPPNLRTPYQGTRSPTKPSRPSTPDLKRKVEKRVANDASFYKGSAQAGLARMYRFLKLSSMVNPWRSSFPSSRGFQRIWGVAFDLQKTCMHFRIICWCFILWKRRSCQSLSIRRRRLEDATIKKSSYFFDDQTCVSCSLPSEESFS